MRKRIAESFKTIRPQLFVDDVESNNDTAVGGVSGGGNSTHLHERGRLKVFDHLGNMDSFFRTWIPAIKKDIEMSALIMGQMAHDMGDRAFALARTATAELRRIPVKYGRLRRKLESAFVGLEHKVRPVCLQRSSLCPHPFFDACYRTTPNYTSSWSLRASAGVRTRWRSLWPSSTTTAIWR